uniref:Uncharacterized protein n=1 Tax=Aegilops tauschii TaxID=37682 RepID=M8BX27_AEGTA
MPIALESGALFGRGVPAACAGSSSAGRGSSSQAEAVHLEESEESEGEVQSSLRGPFDTMDALQEALPRRRYRETELNSVFYEVQSSSISLAQGLCNVIIRGLRAVFGIGGSLRKFYNWYCSISLPLVPRGPGIEPASLHCTSQGRETSKIDNTKSSSLASAGDVVLLPQSSKGLANPENPSPKKRKGPLPFGIDQNESQSKELSFVGDMNNSPTNCRMPSSPAATSSSPCKSRSEDEHECCNDMPCHNLQREFSDMIVFSSPPLGLQTQLIAVSTVGQQDVGASTDVVSPREKRRKN